MAIREQEGDLPVPAQIIVAYRTPADPRAFDKYYFETHVPIAWKIPGVCKYHVSRGPIATPAGPSPYHLIATLTFDSVADIQKAFASPEGQAAAADVQKFATGGVEMNFFESGTV